VLVLSAGFGWSFSVVVRGSQQPAQHTAHRFSAVDASVHSSQNPNHQMVDARMNAHGLSLRTLSFAKWLLSSRMPGGET
jgi:hypothetical protein